GAGATARADHRARQAWQTSSGPHWSKGYSEWGMQAASQSASKCLMRRDRYQAELAEMRPQAARNASVATALRYRSRIVELGVSWRIFAQSGSAGVPNRRWWAAAISEGCAGRSGSAGSR